jgi:hypothetical protein
MSALLRHSFALRARVVNLIPDSLSGDPEYALTTAARPADSFNDAEEFSWPLIGSAKRIPMRPATSAAPIPRISSRRICPGPLIASPSAGSVIGPSFRDCKHLRYRRPLSLRVPLVAAAVTALIVLSIRWLSA